MRNWLVLTTFAIAVGVAGLSLLPRPSPTEPLSQAHNEYTAQTTERGDSAILVNKPPEPATQPGESLLDFPDGSTMAVQWHQYPVDPYSEIDFAQYDSIRRKALNGDAWANFAMHRMQRRCINYYQSENDLDNAMSEMHQTRTRTFKMDEHDAWRVFDVDDDLELEETKLRSRFADCEQARIYDDDTSTNWLEQAANAGLPYAIDDYAQALGNAANAELLHRTNWHQGYYVALERLWEI